MTTDVVPLKSTVDKDTDTAPTVGDSISMGVTESYSDPSFKS